jgi:excisionase family DNA binding protein
MEEVTRVCLSVSEVGRKLHVSRATAYTLCHAKGFPAIRIGRRLLVPVAALDVWLRKQTEVNVDETI